MNATLYKCTATKTSRKFEHAYLIRYRWYDGSSERSSVWTAYSGCSRYWPSWDDVDRQKMKLTL